MCTDELSLNNLTRKRAPLVALDPSHSETLVRHIELASACGEVAVVNGRKSRCKYHFGDQCFTALEHAIKLVQPQPRDGRSVPWFILPGCVEFDILVWSLNGCEARADFPMLAPARFQREQRLYEPTQTLHYGWTPVWPCGASWPNWSYQAGTMPNKKLRDANAALRLEVMDQIEDVRRGCGSDMHVHHEPPMTFKRIVTTWADRENIKIEAIPLYEPHPCHKLIADRDMAARWQVFHAENADLRLLTANEHRAAHKPPSPHVNRWL